MNSNAFNRTLYVFAADRAFLPDSRFVTLPLISNVFKYPLRVADAGGGPLTTQSGHLTSAIRSLLSVNEIAPLWDSLASPLWAAIVLFISPLLTQHLVRPIN